jgi:hypothetical protein
MCCGNGISRFLGRLDPEFEEKFEENSCERRQERGEYIWPLSVSFEISIAHFKASKMKSIYVSTAGVKIWAQFVVQTSLDMLKADVMILFVLHQGIDIRIKSHSTTTWQTSHISLGSMHPETMLNNEMLYQLPGLET